MYDPAMNDVRFDDLTKALASGLPRRTFLKMVGAGLLALGRSNDASGHAAADEDTALRSRTASPLSSPEVTCPHEGHQRVCNGMCCANHGTCATKGRARGVTCANGGCCANGERCCPSRDERGHITDVCCKAHETCEVIVGQDGTATGRCRPIPPLL